MNNKHIVILIIITILLLSLAAFYTSGSTALGEVVLPLQSLTSAVTMGFVDLFADREDLVAENQRLTARTYELEARIRMLEQHSQENERLSALLELAEENEPRMVAAAQVIARDFDNFHHTMVINRGASHGVEI